MNEVWHPVVGYEGSYEVSNLGRVKSLERMVPQRWGMYRKCPEKILRQKTARGYFQVRLTGKTFNVHVLVAAAFIGPRPKGMVICHGRLGMQVNTPENLRYDTQLENMRDVKRHQTLKLDPPAL